MTLLDKATQKRITEVRITSTEDEYWTKWILFNDTGYAARFAINASPQITIVSPLPEIMQAGQKQELDVKIATRESGLASVEVIPSIVDVHIR